MNHHDPIAVSGVLLKRDLSRREAYSHAQEWREAYCRSLYEATGRWTLNHLDWHAFQAGYVDCSSGLVAVDRFTARGEIEAILRWEHGRCALVHIVSPVEFYSSWRAAPMRDLYVSSPELTWTFVMPHEVDQDAGPFFAEREVDEPYGIRD